MTSDKILKLMEKSYSLHKEDLKDYSKENNDIIHD